MRNNALSVSAKGIAKTTSIITNIRSIPEFVMFFFTKGSSMYCLYFSDLMNFWCNVSELWTQKKPVSRKKTVEGRNGKNIPRVPIPNIRKPDAMYKYFFKWIISFKSGSNQMIFVAYSYNILVMKIVCDILFR